MHGDARGARLHHIDRDALGPKIVRECPGQANHGKCACGLEADTGEDRLLAEHAADIHDAASLREHLTAVDEDVEAPEAFDDRVDQPFDLNGIALVGPKARRADAMAFQFTDDCLSLVA
jgi:hypothetical protein